MFSKKSYYPDPGNHRFSMDTFSAEFLFPFQYFLSFTVKIYDYTNKYYNHIIVTINIINNTFFMA